MKKKSKLSVLYYLPPLPMELNKYFDAEFTKLLEKYNGFFAFGTRQFEEAKKEGYRYINMWGGLLIGRPEDANIEPQAYGDQFWAELETITKESARRDLEEFGLERIIRYELDNHETEYTWNIQPAFEALEKFGATLDQVRLVFRGKSIA